MEPCTGPWRMYDNKLNEVAGRLDTTADEVELLVEGVRALSALLTDLSQTRRKGTGESDTDHTVTLAVVACALAAKHLPELDIGRVAQYALVHDLPEAYCGDISTADETQVDVIAKEAAEKAARARIDSELGVVFPWLTDTLGAFERLGDPEACFVKTLDKAMPAIMHNLNDGALFKGEDPRRLRDEVHAHGDWLRSKDYAKNEELALSIREVLMEWVIARQREKHSWLRPGSAGQVV